ncbi:MAG: hypothetical protein OHK93_002251 [Ramalina farinacea]|uniref:2-nitropropane dioxygenase n=1 Tax=Ramalina farinacea TaxID=258253 RepID=A0AA43QQZ9_9LECA|nr:hypothetical protein [Ramalina farinacea]
MAPNNPPNRLSTPLTTLLHLKHPILLAGMAHCSTGPLAAAVSNAGGLGTVGGLGYTPQTLRSMIHELKSLLHSASLPFGVDLALPAVGGTARKTNHDYTHGQLDALVDVIIEEGAALFVSAVGVPPQHVIQRLHDHGVVVMNMVGHPRHATKAFDAGVDIVCAQGGEGGGHTGEIPMSILVPACVDIANRYRPAMLARGKTQQQAGLVVAAGGIYDGRGLAAALALGAVGVWVGTRFVASSEAGCSDMHKRSVVECGWEDTVRTLVVSGRPLRARRNEYLDGWEGGKGEVERLTSQGVVPMERDLETGEREVDMPFLMGQVAAMVGEVKPAGVIVEDMVQEAVEWMGRGAGFVVTDGGGRESKL